MKIYLSGSTSTLGKTLISEFSTRGLDIKPLVTQNQDQWRLGNSVLETDTKCFLIHLAHDRSMSLEETIVTHSKLIETFPGKVIFVSSLSAFPQTLSRYGKQKLLIEKLVLNSNGIVINEIFKFPLGQIGIFFG